MCRICSRCFRLTRLQCVARRRWKAPLVLLPLLAFEVHAIGRTAHPLENGLLVGDVAGFQVASRVIEESAARIAFAN